MCATHPKPYTPYTSALLQKRDVTIDRGGVEATDAFVLAYHSGTRLHFMSPRHARRRKSSRSCANLELQSSERGRKLSRCCANSVPYSKRRRKRRKKKERGERTSEKAQGRGNT